MIGFDFFKSFQEVRLCVIYLHEFCDKDGTEHAIGT